MKILKYKLATEIPHDVVVEVPLLDDDGNPIMNEIATPVTEDIEVPVLDENGEPLFGENGEPAMEVVTQPVLDENGEPVVEITYEPVLVEETRQEIELVLNDVSIACPTQKSLDANLPVAQREAYNGEYTIDGEFDPEPDTTTTDDVLNALLGVTE